MRYLYLFAAVLYAATAGAQTLTVPATANEGETVIFTYNELPDSMFFQDQVTIDFGDGTSLVTNAIGRTARLSIAHTYQDDAHGAPYTVTVTEDDLESGSVESTAQIEIRNVVPVVTLASSYTVSEGRLSGFVPVTDAGSDQIRWQVDYGDSTVQSSGFSFPGGIPLNHTYSATGTYNLVVTVWDDDGAIARGSASVNVSGTVPSAQIAIYNFAGLVVTGGVGHTYEIQKADSAESTNWTPVALLTLSSSSQLWIDMNSTNSPKRFYRAVAR